MFSIDMRSREPIYEQLIKNIINLITQRVLLPDDALPSVRALARDLGINPNTVQKAYHELEARKMIYQVPGKGSFVSQNDAIANAVIAQRTQALEQAVLSAKKAGVRRPDIIELVNRFYEEGER